MQDITRRTCATAVGMIWIASLSGCGGGGSSTNSVPGPGSGTPAGETGQTHSYTFGAITARAVSNSPLTPVTAGGGTSTGPGTLVTGLAGASISSLVLSTTSHSLAQTRIAFASDRNETGVHHIYTANPDGSGILQLTSGSLSDYSPSWSADGSTVLFYSNRAGYNHIYSVPASGGSITQLTSGSFQDFLPVASPDGTRIAFNDDGRDGTSNAHIYTMPAAGGTPTQITTGSFNDYAPQWSPSSSSLVFYSSNRDGSSSSHLYTVPSTGGTPTAITSGAENDYFPAWSPVGGKIAFEDSGRDGSVYYRLYTQNPVAGYTPAEITNDTMGDYGPSWAPDGSRIVFSRGSSPGQIWTANADGSFPVSILADSSADFGSPSWGPFIGSKVLVGTGGSLGATAAGALFGQQNDLVTSVLAFNATTPSTAVINSTTGVSSNLPDVIFNITADNLTSLTYINGNLPTVNTVIGAGGVTTTATGAIVAFNTVTGAVSSVIPTTAAGRAAVRPTREGNILVYRGSFPGVWDETGKNRAPGGATEVRLDGMTGKLISFR